MKYPYDEWLKEDDLKKYLLHLSGIRSTPKKYVFKNHKYKRIKTRCAYCGKTLYRIPARIKLYKFQFCDDYCKSKRFMVPKFRKSIKKRESRWNLLFGKKIFMPDHKN